MSTYQGQRAQGYGRTYMFSVVTGCSRGHVANDSTGAMKTSEIVLIGRLRLPRLHLLGARGSPYQRRQTKQPIVMIYEPRIATCARELTALRAVVEPILIHNHQYHHAIQTLAPAT